MYNPKSIEPKWQKTWQDAKVFRTNNPVTDADFQMPKYYALDMFPYPSGAGLHVGHPKGFIATDIISRYKHAKGFRVLHPMGWDSFGLPAENYAIKTGVHPKITTDENIANFQRQLQALGLSYDWDREIATTDPKYYKWTQWIFLKLFEAGLAYEQDLPINYCPSCKTGLANEEVVGDNICDRCSTKVERRKIRQWVLAITKYAERLLADVDSLDWPEGIKEMQRNWIGKSEGVEFEMKKALSPLEKGGQGGLDTKPPLALILHGWEGKADSNWFMSTKVSLEQMGYEVMVPDLPNSNTPDLDEQLAFLQQFSSRLNEQSVIIGHSLGGQLAAKFIESLNTKIWTLIMVAPTYPWVADDMKITGRNLNDHERAFIPYTQSSVTFEKIVRNTTSRILHVSQDDPYVNCDASRNYYQQLSGIKVHTYEAKRHFCMEKFSEVLSDISYSLSVYTTRIDTVYGMTYVVLAADHKDVENWITPEQRSACEVYIAEAKNKSDQDRTNEGKEKTGVFTGSYVVNPFNGERIPVWIGDYVLGSYGTGAVMAVPAHDERDFEFAKKMGLEIKQSIAPQFTAQSPDPDTPRTDKPTVRRKTVKVIVEDWNGERIYGLKWKNGIWNSLVFGWVEEGETVEEAAVREVIEETGYQDIAQVQHLGFISYPYFYIGHKDVNRTGEAHFVVVRLASDLHAAPDQSETVNHDWLWLNKGDIRSFLNLPDNLAAWDIFENGAKAITEDGILVNSAEFSGLSSAEAREKLAEKAEREGFGKKKTNYKLRDWLFSRQRYWGEPIPLIHIANEDYEKLPRNPPIPNAHISLPSPPPEGEGVKEEGWESSFWENTPEYITELARGLRKTATSTEEIMWELLRRKQMNGVKFRRQHPFGRYIADFYSDEAKLVIEIDGKVHETASQKEYDAIRDDVMKNYGVQIVRIQAEEVENDIEQVIKKILVLLSPRGGKVGIGGQGAGDAWISQKDTGEYLMIWDREVSKIHDGLYGKIICDYSLPLELPEVTNYEPAGDGNSPLALVPEFVNVQIADNLMGKRETNTMPQWAGSCWYYLRFMDPTNDQYLVDPKLAEYWGQVDSYVGGAEHAVLHLLYARFWHKFLFDIWVVPTKEPFQSLHNQGMILAYAYERENGGLVASDCVEERDGKFYETTTSKEVKKIVAKMSKSLKNVVNPDAVIEEYGTDTFRLYEMYMSDFRDSAPWNTEAIIGVRRFLERAHTIFETPRFAADDMKAMKLLHKTIKKVGEDIEAFKFNTAISALMILLNEGVPKDEENRIEWKETFAILLHPFAPHLAEELWSMLGKTVSVFEAPWPEYQDFMLVDDEVTIAVQINGKIRGTFTFLNGVAQEEVAARVMEDPSIAKWLEGMTIVREIFVPNKLYGIVAK